MNQRIGPSPTERPPRRSTSRHCCPGEHAVIAEGIEVGADESVLGFAQVVPVWVMAYQADGAPMYDT